MDHEDIDPLTAPIEQVLGSAPMPVAEQPVPELAAPATPPELQTVATTYGSGGPVPVPSVADAIDPNREDAPVQVGTRCECGKWEVVNPGNGEVEEATGCQEVTRNPNSWFAPGHDARFKGLLIRAGERDYRVRERGTDTLRKPTTVAARISTAMARRVEEGIKRRKR